MMHICYIYIYSYRLLCNVGISFDPHYTIEKVGDSLKIDKSDQLPNQFFGAGIYSVTSIVGNNGAGKTSALRFLMECVVDGYRIKEVDGIVVYENGGQLFVYQPPKELYPKLRVDTGLKYTDTESLLSIPVMYYSGHFSPLDDRNDILATELDGSYIASDQWLLIHDLLNYSNFDAIYLSGHMYSYIWAYMAQNNARICELLMIDGIEGLLTDLRLPKYILIGRNDGGVEYLANDSKEHVKVPGFINVTNDVKQNNIARFIYCNFVNLIAEKHTEEERYASLLDAWQKTEKSGDVLDSFLSFIDGYELKEEERTLLKVVHSVLEKLVSICSYDEKMGVFYLEVQSGKKQLREFIDTLLNSHFYVTAKFFDIYYSHGLYAGTKLSSGEQEMLNLLSRIYFSITKQPQRVSNIKSPTLLLLDEAEIGFHPEWQKKYVNLLLQFLRTKNLVKPGADFQLIFTSHSPIILSDMPLCCVNIMQRKENGETEVLEGVHQTFGENVFNLYRRDFVMKDGLVGAFASEKINALYDRIMSGENNDGVVKEVMMIGDERVREYLLSEMSKRDKDYIVSYYKRRITAAEGYEEN